MKDIKKHLCDEMHKFVKEHIDEVEDKKNFWGRNQTYEELGFNSRTDMLRQIKNDPEVAFWALTDLCNWGMSKNYCKKLFVHEETEDIVVYKIGDRYIKNIQTNYLDKAKIVEVKPIKKTIVINVWEEVV